VYGGHKSSRHGLLRAHKLEECFERREAHWLVRGSFLEVGAFSCVLALFLEEGQTW
jgi:hypothetical protein